MYSNLQVGAGKSSSDFRKEETMVLLKFYSLRMSRFARIQLFFVCVIILLL